MLQIALVDGYDGIERSFPPHVRLAPKVAILKNEKMAEDGHDHTTPSDDRATNEAATAA
jgi:hypothetical protein